MATRRKSPLNIMTRWLLGLACAFVTTTGMAANDLLQLPALQSKLAASSVLMDVTRAGKRLVAVGERGHIVLSDDNGEHWTQAEVPVSVTLTAVAFPTPELGWAVGHDNVVLHSSDAGRSWRIQVDGNALNAQMVAAVKRIVEKRRVALEKAPDELREELALGLEDAEFFLNDVKAALAEGTSRPFMDVWFDNEREGVLLGSFGMIFRTEDGGQNWVAIAEHTESVRGFHYYATGEMAGGVLLVVGEEGTLLRSEDRGRSWQKLESPYPGSLFGLAANPRSSCAVGMGLRGNAVRICDQGAVREALPSFGEEALTGGTVLPNGMLVLAGMAPVIHVSRDNGKTFKTVSTQFPGCMAVAHAGDDKLLLVGVGGIHKIDLNETEN